MNGGIQANRWFGSDVVRDLNTLEGVLRIREFARNPARLLYRSEWSEWHAKWRAEVVVEVKERARGISLFISRCIGRLSIIVLYRQLVAVPVQPGPCV